MSLARTGIRMACCAAFPWAPAVDAQAPPGRHANMDSSAACSPAHHQPDNATMSIRNGGRCAEESHEVGLASGNALWQRAKGDAQRRSAGFIRARILFCVELSVTQVLQGMGPPKPAPLTADRSHRRSVVPAHGRQVRSARWPLGSRRRAAAADKGAWASANHRLRPPADRPGRINVPHSRRSLRCAS